MAFDYTRYTPDSWEKFCDQCYILSYGQDANWHKVPSKYLGDCGIEGYLRDGEIVYQCYYPDSELDETLYDKLRDKMTKDLNKLIKNKDKLKSIGINSKIKEWHLVVPEYLDKRILQHKVKKQNEIKKLSLEHISKDFRIIIKQYINFADVSLKVNLILNSKLEEKSFLKKEPIAVNYFDMVGNEKVENVKRKCLVLNPNFKHEEYLEQYKSIVNIYMSYYVKGITILNRLKEQEVLVHDTIQEMASSYKEDAIAKADLNAGNITKDLLDEITEEFQEQLRSKFEQIIDDGFIKKLSTYIVASWIADCSLNFVN